MNEKILIMEDEEILRNILKTKLSKQGYEVVIASDGKEGMNIMENGYVPDLILLDIMMPIMDGFEVLEKMKENDKFSSLPVIIISNSGQPVEIKKAMSLGIVDYLVKVDFSPDEVLNKVGNFFNKNKKSKSNNIIKEEEEEEEVKKSNISNKEKNYKKDGVKILLVEDDDFLRDICKVKLEKEGFNVEVSSDGLDAFKKINEGNSQLILLDVILPRMDGFDILKKIKENPKKKSIPIIMLTNLGQNDEVKRGLDLGAEDYIIKAHFTIGEIIEKVRKVIKKNNIK